MESWSPSAQSIDFLLSLIGYCCPLSGLVPAFMRHISVHSGPHIRQLVSMPITFTGGRLNDIIDAKDHLCRLGRTYQDLSLQL